MLRLHKRIYKIKGGYKVWFYVPVHRLTEDFYRRIPRYYFGYDIDGVTSDANQRLLKLRKENA